MPPEREALLWSIAADQGGVFSIDQARACGWPRRTVHDRVAAGRWHLVHRNVVSFGPLLRADGRRWSAALAWPDGTLSHRTSLAVRELGHSQVLDVTVPSRRRPRGELELHVASLHPEDVEWRDGLRVTSLPRTLLDVFDVGGEAVVRRAFEEADRRMLLDAPSLRRVLDRNPGRRGAPFLRGVLAEYGARAGGHARTPLEDLLRDLARRVDRGRPELNAMVAGREVDLLWRAPLVAVEADSWQFHRTRADFERDREKASHLASHGVLLLPGTHRRLTTGIASLAAEVRRAVDARSGGMAA